MRRTASQPPELPGYTHVKLLGSGGFSDVFLYDQALPRRRVAVKVLLLEELTAATQAAFVAEANLMAQLSTHPYIVTIYQADVAADGRPYFVMEYCSGPSLGDRYKQAPLPVVDALRTGVRLSSAVAVAHQAGILHRDIKPANVLSNDYGWPALTVFGISSAVEDELPLHTTTLSADEETGTGGTSGQVGLSVPWSPPEMFDDDPQPDVRSDVFSLAATIWTVLAGQTPFEVRGRSNGTLDLIGRIERGAITPMERQDVPRSLMAVLQKGMATERTHRFETAVDFARALQRVELELGYARTELEIPNLTLTAPERPADGAEEDETRVRSVATIDAQPAASPAAPVVAQPHFADETQVRGARSIDAQPTPPPAVAAEASSLVADNTVVRRPAAPVAPAGASTLPDTDEPAPTRSRRTLGISIGVVCALVLGAAVVGIVLGGSAEPEPLDTSAPASTDQAAVVPDVIPSPELVGAPAVDGSTLRVTVVNPDEVDADQLVWRISNRSASEPLRAVEGDTIVVDGYDGVSTVCVEVSVRRAGKLSQPLEVCAP
jgi:eukaryotic-like serine/threonine-protein kinase